MLLCPGQDPNEEIRWTPSGADAGGAAGVFCTAAQFCLAPLGFVRRYGQPQLGCLKVLLREGNADANAGDSYGEMPIFGLARRCLGDDEEAGACDLFMAAGARTSGVFSSDGRSPLIVAAEGNNVRLARFLIEDAGAPVDEQNLISGCTALHYGCRSKCGAETATMLLDAGADRGASDNLGATPLFASLSGGDAAAAPSRGLSRRDREQQNHAPDYCFLGPPLSRRRSLAALPGAPAPLPAETRRAVHSSGSSAADLIVRGVAADHAFLASGAPSSEQLRVEGRLFWLLGELLASGTVLRPRYAARLLPIAAARAARQEADLAARRSELCSWRSHEAFVGLALDVGELREAERVVEDRRARVAALELELCELGAGTTGSSSSSSSEEIDDEGSDSDSASESEDG
jgi:hypothetical protein